MAEKTVGYINKTIEVAPGIKVICGGSVTEEDSGIESGSDYLCLVTKRGTERLDSSPYFINLQSATLEGNEIVIKWEKQERKFERRDVYAKAGCTEYLIDYYYEDVVSPRKCEKRFPVV